MAGEAWITVEEKWCDLIGLQVALEERPFSQETGFLIWNGFGYWAAAVRPMSFVTWLVSLVVGPIPTQTRTSFICRPRPPATMKRRIR